MIPPRIKASIDNYIHNRQMPGNFLKAVLSNQLFEAYAFADDDSAENLHMIVKYIYNTAPSASWGSFAEMEAWVAGQ